MSTWGNYIRQQAEQLLTVLPAGRWPAATERPDFGLDTLDFVELVMQVEQQFGFRFSAAELHDLRYAQQVLGRTGQARRRQFYAEFFAQLMQRGEQS